MIDAPLALAFTAGMVASINPCGFALLPAYVAAFVAGDHAATSGHRRVLRAVGVSAAVPVGFAITFVLVGVVFDTASGLLRQRMPWLTIAIGVLMVIAGVAVVHARVVPGSDRIRDERLRSRTMTVTTPAGSDRKEPSTRTETKEHA